MGQPCGRGGQAAADPQPALGTPSVFPVRGLLCCGYTLTCREHWCPGASVSACPGRWRDRGDGGGDRFRSHPWTAGIGESHSHPQDEGKTPIRPPVGVQALLCRGQDRHPAMLEDSGRPQDGRPTPAGLCSAFQLSLPAVPGGFQGGHWTGARRGGQEVPARPQIGAATSQRREAPAGPGSDRTAGGQTRARPGPGGRRAFSSLALCVPCRGRVLSGPRFPCLGDVLRGEWGPGPASQRPHLVCHPGHRRALRARSPTRRDRQRRTPVAMETLAGCGLGDGSPRVPGEALEDKCVSEQSGCRRWGWGSGPSGRLERSRAGPLGPHRRRTQKVRPSVRPFVCLLPGAGVLRAWRSSW